jgi:TRAP transporter TAXI family solute receptor
MKKYMVVLVFIMLVVNLVIVGHPKPVLSAPPMHKPMEAYILSPALGGTGYLFSSALIGILTKHPWLKVSMVAGYHATKAIMEGSTRDPKNILMVGSMTPAQQAWMGVKPFKQKYPNLRLISYGLSVVEFNCTLNPSIKNLEDCIGKRVVVGPRHIPSYLVESGKFEYLGIKDKVTLVEMRHKEGSDALIDGLLDVSHFTVIKTKAGWIPHPAYRELYETKKDKLYYIPVPIKIIDWVLAKYPYLKLSKATIPAGTLGPNQTRPMTGHSNDVAGIACFAGADEEMVYEVTKALAENIDALTTYGAELGAIDRENLIGKIIELWPDTWRNLIHPGALKYYKEAGLVK